MKDSIQLSPKHGVNPTIPICFWCGKEKNEVVLLGLLKGDIKAPKNSLLDFTPCPECQAIMNQGIRLMETIDHAHPDMPTLPPVRPGIWLTGHYMVVTEDAVRTIFTEPAWADILKARGAYLDTQIYHAIQQAIEPTTDNITHDEEDVDNE